MQPLNKLEEDSFFRLLLQGEPGSGKTDLLCGLPGVAVIDIDGNLAGPVRRRRVAGLPVPIGYFRLDRDDEGKEILPGAGQYARLDQALVACQKDDACQTIGLDSATTLADIMLMETSRKNPSLKDGRQVFQFFLQDCKRLMALLTRMKKNIVLTAHERVEYDEMTTIKNDKGEIIGGTKQYRVVWPGQFGDYIGAFFTNVWRTEITSMGYPPVYKRVVRTIGDAQHPGLKNDCSLPPVWTFNWEELQQKLNSKPTNK